MPYLHTNVHICIEPIVLHILIPLSILSLMCWIHGSIQLNITYCWFYSTHFKPPNVCNFYWFYLLWSETQGCSIFLCIYQYISQLQNARRCHKIVSFVQSGKEDCMKCLFYRVVKYDKVVRPILHMPVTKYETLAIRFRIIQPSFLFLQRLWL